MSAGVAPIAPAVALVIHQGTMEEVIVQVLVALAVVHRYINKY